MDSIAALANHILIFTDGACSGNPGPGGWGAIVVTPEGHVRELAGGHHETTNNRMELSGAIHALRAVEKFPQDVLLYTDSTYVIRGITQWIWGWRKKNWVNGEGQPVLNRDLWEELDRLLMLRGRSRVQFKYSRGHRGIPGNERCDEIAVAQSKGQRINLYEGPLLRYPVPIHDLPPDEPLPEMRPSEPKKPAYSYLSLVNGKVMRHGNWASCEARVKGRSGAKFKKAMAAEEEAGILAAWGVSPGTSIEDA